MGLRYRCYISSVLQLLFSFPEFVERYFETAAKHMTECTRFPPDCFNCQMAKIAYGLCSGAYSQPKKEKKVFYEGQTEEEKAKEHFYQQGICPRMFKTFVGKGHPDFSTAQQQDASLYFAYLLDKIQVLFSPITLKNRRRRRQPGPETTPPASSASKSSPSSSASPAAGLST